MHFRSVVSFASAAVLATVVAGPAGAATHHAGTPSVWTIITKSTAALSKAAAAHGVGVSTIASKVKTKNGIVNKVDKGSFSGDASVNGKGIAQVSEVLTSKVNGVKSGYTLEYSDKGNKIAARIAGNKKWTCGSTGTILNSIDVWTPNDFSNTFPTQAQAKKAGYVATLAGTKTYNGSSVYIVKLKVTKTNKTAKASESLSDTVYVNQANFLAPYSLEIQTVRSPQGSSTETNTLTLSKFGEKLSVNMHGC